MRKNKATLGFVADDALGAKIAPKNVLILALIYFLLIAGAHLAIKFTSKGSPQSPE
jgi:hypothetical protein